MTGTPHLLVTGGAGFIGSCFVGKALREGCRVTVVDAMTYAAHPDNLKAHAGNPNFTLVQADINERERIEALLRGGVTQLVHIAAESHVDNSIRGPAPFIHTNIVGSFQLLEAARAYWGGMSAAQKAIFRFLHVSTDEVYGALGPDGAFNEQSQIHPNSPYSASKAASDHLARAWQHTYGLPVIVTHCGNNYGPRQHPEKLIPTVITSAFAERPIPVFGDGRQVRDWIHVSDHCHGLWLALTRGTPGETYDFSGHGELENTALIRRICSLMDEKRPRANGQPHSALITHVADRPGHDRRYAIDDSYARRALGFARETALEEGLSETIDWYLANGGWCRDMQERRK